MFWAPHCRYIHPENGEVLPALSLERSFRREMRPQGFGPQDPSQQPPGWSSLPPQTLRPTPVQSTSTLQVEEERRIKVEREFLQLIVPNILCLTDFPNLGKSQKLKNKWQ